MRLAYDIGLRRPACVLVAAAFGADPGASQAFPSEMWLLTPTAGMRVYDVDHNLLEQIVAATGVVPRDLS